MASNQRAKGRIAVRGLTTVALLKAQFDTGKDYLDMFMPFVIDAIAAMPAHDLDVGMTRDAVQQRFGLAIPVDTVQTLLRRATRRAFLRREGGRYFKTDVEISVSEIVRERKGVAREIKALSRALQDFALEQGMGLETDEDASALLFEFLSENRSALLLDDEFSGQYELVTGNLGLEQTRIVARFISEVCLNDPELARYLDDVVVGFVLQSALLLKDVTSFSGSFNNLQVYFDSSILFSALGYTGEALKVATVESIELLRSTEALVRVLDVTVTEMKAILGVYESHLATPRGKETLYPTDLTRFFLTQRFTPGDIRQEIALLETNLKSLGLEIIAKPNRAAAYTQDEISLANQLKRPDDRGDEPRIVHDVDCIASILTIRRGQVTNTLDATRAVFVTGSAHVVDSVNKWYATTEIGGVSPIIHYRVLSNAAWLKKPASAAKLKLHELVALCAAALRPSRQTWEKFLRHLRHLEETREITTDEAVAVVVSGFTDRALSRIEIEDPDLDADSLTEVVERVKATYRAEADEKIAAAKAALDAEKAKAETEARSARSEREKAEAGRQQIIRRVESRIDRVSNVISAGVAAVLGIMIMAGAALLLPTVFDALNPRYRLAAWILVVVASIFSILALLRGTHVGQFRLAIKDNVREVLRKWFLELDG